jgi:hypothetical protein
MLAVVSYSAGYEVESLQRLVAAWSSLLVPVSKPHVGRNFAVPVLPLRIRSWAFGWPLTDRVLSASRSLIEFFRLAAN